MANLNFFAKNLKFFPKNLKFPFRGLFRFRPLRYEFCPSPCGHCLRG